MPKLVKRTSVKTFTWKAIKASVSKSTLSKIPKKFISYVPITYYSRKAHYILRKKVRPSITPRKPRNRTDQIKPILFIIFCAKEKINLAENLFWQKIEPIHLYIIAPPFFLNFTFLSTKPKKKNLDKRKLCFLQFAEDYKKLFGQQTELEVKAENFDPTDYIHEIDIKEEPLEIQFYDPKQSYIKEEPL